MSDPVFEETLHDRRRGAPARLASSSPQLFLAIECSSPLAGSARHALLNVDEVLFGRGSERVAERVVEDGVRKLVLRVPDPRMSARHARLVKHGSSWSFEDLGSTNGSRLDAAPVTSAPLADGALLELGHTFFLYRESLATEASTPGDVDASDLLETPHAFATLIPALSAAFETLARIARSNVPILLLGETGSGKELLARAAHEASGRSGEFVAINCGAIPDSLMEAQLFGHVKGAFSGASRDEPGYVRSAHRGTLFLDEIGELPPSSQAALLRVLQENEVVPVGTTRPISVDIRVIAATHAPIDELVRSGTFRNDLFARLAGFRFEAPPLRERMEDLGLLIANLLPEIGKHTRTDWKIDPAAAFALFKHDWPRNTRELKQCLASAAVLGDYKSIELAHLASALREPQSASRPSSGAPPSLLPLRSEQYDEQLRRELIACFTECKGNVSEVARRMGKARVQIQRWMKRFSIDPTAFRG